MNYSDKLNRLADRVENHNRIKTLELSNHQLQKKVDAEAKSEQSFRLEGNVIPTMELSEGFKMPLEVEFDIIEEGMFLNTFLPASEIIAAKDTFFFEDENFENYIIHIDHMHGRKPHPWLPGHASVSTRIGRILDVWVEDEETGKLRGRGIITNEDYARAVFHGVTNKVSVRARARNSSLVNGVRIGRNLVFEELSLVVNDEYKKSKIWAI